jgi:hypothetical protein
MASSVLGEEEEAVYKEYPSWQCESTKQFTRIAEGYRLGIIALV